MSDSLITKRAIAEALKQVCREKPFDKISISNITSVWGLNRQTFYYHFQDKYELLSWIYYNENFAKIAEDITLENWDQKIYELLQNMKEEKAFISIPSKNRNIPLRAICLIWQRPCFPKQL